MVICPYCATHIPEGSLRCPACHADLELTQMLPRLDRVWCECCGSLIPSDAEDCPYCGMPVERKTEHASHKTSEPTKLELEQIESEQTHAMPRFESVVPSGPEPCDPTGLHDHMPRKRAMVVAGLASLLIVGGSILMITHPWAPGKYDTKATEPADTSMVGYPGSLAALSGQDSSAPNIVRGDEDNYELIYDIWDSLAEMEETFDQDEQTLRSLISTGTYNERVAAQQAHATHAETLAALIASLDNLDESTGTYTQAAENIKLLGGYLSRWSDAIATSWEVMLSQDEPTEYESEILAPLATIGSANGTNTYRELFDKNYDAWEPQSPNDS